MSYAAVYLSEFPISAWKRSLKSCSLSSCSQALVLLDGVAPQEKVAARCEKARQWGIAHGMTKVQAQAAGDALFRARDKAQEHEAFTAARRIAEQFTPRLQAIASPANEYGGAQPLSAMLLLDSSGTQTLFGTIENYASQLHAAFAADGFPSGIGTAANAEAALMLARSTRHIVNAEDRDVCAKLAPLPVTLLPCDTRMLALLSRWGIRTLGQLAELPDTALVSRLGQSGRRLQSLARGEGDHFLVPEEQVFTLTTTAVLDSPVEVLESLLFVLSPMLETILAKAMEQAYAVRSLQLTLLLERGEPHTCNVRPASPSQNREALLKLLNLELQSKPPPAAVLSMTLAGEPAKPQIAQRGLFQAQFPDPDKLDLLFARLRLIAGEDNVGSPVLKNSYRQDAFTLAHFEPQLPDTMVRDAAEQLSQPARVALRVFRPPQSVRVACRDDQPQMLFWKGTKIPVQICAGPWHSSGSWWDNSSWEDDLWDVVVAPPRQALRLRQDLGSKAWFVVGLYD